MLPFRCLRVICTNVLICDAGPVDLRQASTVQAVVVLSGGMRRAVEYGGVTLSW